MSTELNTQCCKNITYVKIGKHGRKISILGTNDHELSKIIVTKTNHGYSGLRNIKFQPQETKEKREDLERNRK